MSTFNLKFPFGKLSHWASRYKSYSDIPLTEIAPQAKKQGYLTRPQFLEICAWKTPRSKPHCAKNDPDFVKAITSFAFSSPNEQIRIEVLTLLAGVGFPTASTILHFCHPTKYPILDFRALYSLGISPPPKYAFPFWKEYAAYCRKLSDKSGLDMRAVDKALWQFSKEKQK